MDLEIVLLASLTMFIAETYASAIGGGGSFLAQPVMIAMGIPANIAVAHDVSSCMGTCVGGAYYYHKKRILLWDLAKWFIPTIALGGFIGAYALSITPSYLIEKFIAIAIIIVAIYMIFIKEIGIKTKQLPKYWQAYSLFFGLLIGLHQGFSGAGTGIVFHVVLLLIFGTTIIQAKGVTKLAALMSHVMAFATYYFFGLIYLEMLIPMTIATFFGGYCGSFLAVRIGNKILKNIFIVFIVFMAMWLLLKT